MNVPSKFQTDAEGRRCLEFRAGLIAEHGDAIDEETLADTIEGMTDMHELLAAVIRGALDDQARVAAIADRITDLRARIQAFEARSERRRQHVRDAMEKYHISKITPPDFTASLRAAQPHVVIVDETQIPERYIEQRPHILKREIGDDLKDGLEVAGATLSNPAMVLSVRTR